MHTSILTHRLAALLALSAIATVPLAAPVAAGPPPVDPTTLNPPPPDFFNAECGRTGQHILCTLHFEDDPVVNEPSGIFCDGTEILFSQTRAVVGKRTYSGDGDLLQRHFREDLAGTLTNPTTGRTFDWIGQDTVIHDLTVPGDVLTGTTTLSGTAMRVFDDHGGVVLVDAGRVTVDAATDTIVGSHGPHRFDDYFVRGDADALAAVCDALS